MNALNITTDYVPNLGHAKMVENQSQSLARINQDKLALEEGLSGR